MAEKKKRVTLFSIGSETPYAFLILNESQIRLLDYLFENYEMRKDFSYTIEENEEEKWQEI